MRLTLNQLEFESILFINNPRKFQVVKVRGSFPISRFAEVTFPESDHFLDHILHKRNGVIRRFCDVTYLT